MFDLQKYSSRLAIRSDIGESITYAELTVETEKFHDAIPYDGLVFILCENVMGSLLGYISCMTKHIPCVLLDGSKDIELIQHLIAIYHPEFIWLYQKRVGEFVGTVIYKYENYSMLQMRYDRDFSEKDKAINPNLLLCLTTSGSTASPKFVRLSEKNLRSNAESIAEYLQIDENERPVMSLPMYYSFGMSVINSHLIKGATILLTDKTVLQRDFWDFIKEEKATSIAGVPYTYEMLRRLKFFCMDLPYLKTMTQAGGKMNSAYVKEYVDFAEANNKRFVVMYGQTEASPRMSYLPHDKAVDKYASIGIAIPGGKFSLIDAGGDVIKDADVEGELVYEGENVCWGYSEKRQDLQLGDENHGILYTGDIAKRDVDGFFYIEGRMKRFVKVMGNRCNLDAVEQFVKVITADCACVGVDDRISVFVTQNGLEDDIKHFLVAKTGFNQSVFRVLVIAVIPKSNSGKIQYPELQRML